MARRFQAVAAGHVQVHQDDVGTQFTCDGLRSASVIRLAYDLDIGLAIEDEAKAVAHQRLVVHEQGANHG